MTGAIEIFVSDVNDVEALVHARYVGPDATPEKSADQASIVLQGKLRGPYCQHSRTLPAEFAFCDLGPKQPGVALAVVTDPSLWTPELPHLYRADLEARQDEHLVAEYHGMIGLRRAAKKND